MVAVTEMLCKMSEASGISVSLFLFVPLLLVSGVDIIGIFYFRILSFFPRRIGSLFEIWEKMKKFDSESEKKQEKVFL